MEKNTVVFIPESEQAGLLFEKHMDMNCDYPYQRHKNNFFFPLPETMELDEFTGLLDGLLKHHDDIAGTWTAVACQSPESILREFDSFSADMQQYGNYYLPEQIERHEEYADVDTDEEDETGIQNDQITREENMTIAILHRIPDAVELLRKTLLQDISDEHKKEIENLLLGMKLSVEL